MKRRTFLKTLAALPAVAAGQETPLREHAAPHGLLYGAAASYPALRNDAGYAAAFARECGLLVPENALKWAGVRPSADRFDFEQADWLHAFARKNGMKFRGHCLVWHNALPRWFQDTATAANARALLENHVRAVVAHYKGRIHSWDVVNEAVNPRDGRDDGLRKTPWLELLGPEYLDIAYRTAAEADPGALLVYNDYGVDYDEPAQEDKRKAVLSLLRRMKKDGVPVHAFGMQAHLAGENPHFRAEVLTRFFGEIAGLGLKILITELDVRDDKLPADVAARDHDVAAVYDAYLSAAMKEPALVAVLTWGLSDRYTWLAYRAGRKDGALARPLPLDRDFQRKPAWKAMAAAFDSRA